MSNPSIEGMPSRLRRLVTDLAPLQWTVFTRNQRAPVMGPAQKNYDQGPPPPLELLCVLHDRLLVPDKTHTFRVVCFREIHAWMS